jgi:hypothetical protein
MDYTTTGPENSRELALGAWGESPQKVEPGLDIRRWPDSWA